MRIELDGVDGGCSEIDPLRRSSAQLNRLVGDARIKSTARRRSAQTIALSSNARARDRWTAGRVCLESQLGEEPLVFAALEARLELPSDLLECGFLVGRILDRLVIHGLLERKLDLISGRHQMLVVVDANERLHARETGALLLGQTAYDLARVTVYAGHQRVTERLVRTALVEVFDDHRFATGETAVQHDDHLVGSHDFAHFRFEYGVWLG